MTDITCRFGSAQAVTLPDWLTDPSEVADYFREASGGAVALEIDTMDLDAPMLDKAGSLGSYDLHTSLRQLIGEQSVPAKTIGVLMAQRYRYADLFGIMFDTAFDLDKPSEGNLPLLAGVPREGCAIFLDAIASRRQAGFASVSQSFFTTVHELGHVFNLRHQNNERCFMCESLPYETYDDSYWRFTNAQQLFLQRARPEEKYVWPGGSRFADLGFNSDGAEEPIGKRVSPVAVKLSIARDRFHHFDPVELDIAVSLRPGRVRAVSIPDVVDPGYSSFRVWIEEPNGERRLFRSPRHYCWSGTMRQIGANSPFRRDISLFGESGGYTFRRKGLHRVWAELDIPGCAPTRSNDVSFEIAGLATEKETADAIFFSSSAVRTVLYHRIDRHRGRGVRMLREWLSARPGHAAAPSVRYAIARAILEKAPLSKGRRQGELVTTARTLMKKSVDAESLGVNQRSIANELIATV